MWINLLKKVVENERGAIRCLGIKIGKYEQDDYNDFIEKKISEEFGLDEPAFVFLVSRVKEVKFFYIGIHGDFYSLWDQISETK